MRTSVKGLQDLEKKIGVRFRDKNLLQQALIHRSALREAQAFCNNERLEFLGDAVLELVATQYLYHLTDRPEGELTNWRSALVQRDNLAAVARDLGLGEHLTMSKGEEASDGRNKDSTLANALEAVIGAVYLDQGMDAATVFCEKMILVRLRGLLAEGRDRDEKSRFQELAQEKLGITPHYDVITSSGPDHEKTFTCAVFVGDKKIAEGTGNSKQKAEQEAAKAALKAKKW